MDDTKPNEQRKRYAPYKKFIGPIVPNWIMRRTDLSQGSKLCFGRLLQFAGKNDYAFPGLEALAKELGVSVPAVKSYLRALSKLGVIESQRMGSGNFSFYFFIEREGVVEFRTDGQKAIRQTNERDRQESTPPVGQNSISPITEEENQNEIHNQNQQGKEIQSSVPNAVPQYVEQKNSKGEYEW